MLIQNIYVYLKDHDNEGSEEVEESDGGDVHYNAFQRGEMNEDDEEKENEEKNHADSEQDPDDQIIDNKCPVCNRQFKNLLLHIKKAKKCMSSIGDKKLKELQS